MEISCRMHLTSGNSVCLDWDPHKGYRSLNQWDNPNCVTQINGVTMVHRPFSLVSPRSRDPLSQSEAKVKVRALIESVNL